MSLALGKKLKVRAMIYVAGEPVPFFWPMRSFIHHNPLHGLEHFPFDEAVEQGSKIFHGRAFLPRPDYQRYLADGDVDQNALEADVKSFVDKVDSPPGIDLQHWLMTLLTKREQPVINARTISNVNDIRAVLNGGSPSNNNVSNEEIDQLLSQKLLGDRPVYEAVDMLYGSELGNDLDDLVIKSCLDFFDEGQSVWGMPERELGFFKAWREVAMRNVRLFLRGIHINQILAVDDSPEGIITHVMDALGVPEEEWVGYFTNEIARLHGWAGFIRWRSNAKYYFWTKKFPADLVDFVAIRLALGLALLQESERHDVASTGSAIHQSIANNPRETYLRYEYYSGNILPAQAHEVDMAIACGSDAKTEKVFSVYIDSKRNAEAHQQAKQLLELAEQVDGVNALKQLSDENLEVLINSLSDFEQQEGMCWLRAMETKAMGDLSKGLSLAPAKAREKRPFVQALFCIDTRSERIRRHLETVGDYQTFGIAGFFGVPVSFMELGKGSENHLCPVILTPKNLVLEMTTSGFEQDDVAVTALGKAMHELKESILTPFVTVEAIGLLFGFDMVGKTVAPKHYNRWRKKINPDKPTTRLLLDKLSREQADSILRTVQRAVIIKAVEEEFDVLPEQVNDNIVRELRECALGNPNEICEFSDTLGVSSADKEKFVNRLRTVYRINSSFSHMQMEQLGRIGFTLDEQANFVSQALYAIGLTKGFSRFILLVGHGSMSDNNPYESALDCGACGGNHGLVNARVIAQMGNKAEVRRKLRERGIDIPDDVWFVPGLHNTTTDEIKIFDVDLMPPSHLVYLDRMRSGLTAASHLCAQERMPTLLLHEDEQKPAAAFMNAQRNAMDWSQVRPEWGLSRNAYFIIGRRNLTEQFPLDGRAFLHSYDFKVDPNRRVLENIITGPLVVGQWINMEHYFSAVDNERFGSSSKAYHNVAGRFGVMTGNLSDLRTGLPSQTVLENGRPYHQPIRLITLIEAPFDHAQKAVDAVVSVKNLVRNGWVRLMVIDPETNTLHTYDDGDWSQQPHDNIAENLILEESGVS